MSNIFQCILTGTSQDYYRVGIGYTNGDWNVINLKNPLPKKLRIFHPPKSFFEGDCSELLSAEEAIKKLLACTYDAHDDKCFYPNEETFKTVVEILKNG